MIVVLAAAVSLIFGAGISLVLSRDTVRIAAGTALIGNSAVLYIMSARLTRGSTPFLPDGAMTDPLVQALALTAIVINFALSALALALALRLERQEHSLDVERVAEPPTAEDGSGVEPTER